MTIKGKLLPNLLNLLKADLFSPILRFFFNYQIKRPDLRNDVLLEQVHWATNRHVDWAELKVFAFDHRSQMEEMQ